MEEWGACTWESWEGGGASTFSCAGAPLYVRAGKGLLDTGTRGPAWGGRTESGDMWPATQPRPGPAHSSSEPDGVQLLGTNLPLVSASPRWGGSISGGRGAEVTPRPRPHPLTLRLALAAGLPSEVPAHPAPCGESFLQPGVLGACGPRRDGAAPPCST